MTRFRRILRRFRRGRHRSGCGIHRLGNVLGWRGCLGHIGSAVALQKLLRCTKEFVPEVQVEGNIG